MEQRFGHDFSQVRIHTDSKAAESARALNAMAYTFGRDVVFGPGRYSPMTSSGTRLLAHELTHTIQQNAENAFARHLPATTERGRSGDDVAGGECAECKKSNDGLQPKLTIRARNDLLEREADRVADRVVAGSTPISAGHALSSVQREAGPSMYDGDTAPPSVEGVLAGSSTPLQPEFREKMEQRFGYDFSRVRVHTDGAAELSAREIDANAYTVGNDIVFGAGKFAPASPSGQRLIAHELAHVVQQSGADGTRELQRQQTAGPAATPSAQPVGDAIKPEIEGLLKAFASASGTAAKNAIGMQAVQTIIGAYGMSTKGLRTMRFDPNLDPKAVAQAPAVEGKVRASDIEFGPGAFNKGFEWLVHTVAHELEHVRQHLIGGYHSGDADEPVKEFLASNGEVLQVQSVAGPAGRGFIGGLIAGAGKSLPALPALPPDLLASVAKRALEEFGRMPAADQAKYRQELASARDKLFDRLKNEAPRALQPPARNSPEWVIWFEDRPSTADPFTMEYQDWLDSRQSPWVEVKAIWKQFDAAFKVR
jgi:hypothetical protein